MIFVSIQKGNLIIHVIGKDAQMDTKDKNQLMYEDANRILQEVFRKCHQEPSPLYEAKKRFEEHEKKVREVHG